MAKKLDTPGKAIEKIGQISRDLARERPGNRAPMLACAVIIALIAVTVAFLLKANPNFSLYGAYLAIISVFVIALAFDLAIVFIRERTQKVVIVHSREQLDAIIRDKLDQGDGPNG